VAFWVVLPLLKRFLERSFKVKIEYQGVPALWSVRGGTPAQRVIIPLINLAYIWSWAAWPSSP
jgi:hypothetical protein